MITNEIHVVYTETRVGKLDHARGGGVKGSHMGKGHKAGVSVYFGHMSSFFQKGCFSMRYLTKRALSHVHAVGLSFFMKIHIYFMF